MDRTKKMREPDKILHHNTSEKDRKYIKGICLTGQCRHEHSKSQPVDRGISRNKGMSSV